MELLGFCRRIGVGVEELSREEPLIDAAVVDLEGRAEEEVLNIIECPEPLVIVLQILLSFAHGPLPRYVFRLRRTWSKANAQAIDHVSEERVRPQRQ